MYLLLVERFVPGVGEGVTKRIEMRRELIHHLFITSHTHSELVKHFRVSKSC